MPERIRYKSPEELKEEDIETRVKEKGPEGELLGGVVYEEEEDKETGEKKNYIYIGNPYTEQPNIIKLETYATREQIEAIKQDMIPMRETYEMLEAMAETYKLKEPLIIEGGTALGKTFTVEKFTELLYGPGVKPLDFYCSGQTDVSELMAKWVPRTESATEQKKWQEFLNSLEAQAKMADISKEAEEKQQLSSEQRFTLVQSKLRDLARSAGLSEKTQWQFQYGAVPKAMTMVRNPDGTASFDDSKGEGFILHIEEVGLAEPQVTNALLKLRGKQGKLTEDMQLWENGGRTLKAGSKFWVVMSTNPPEDYGSGRNEIDAALARGVVFKRMGDLSRESLDLVAGHYFMYKFEKLTEKPEGCILDIYNHPEIGKYIANTVASFHEEFKTALKDGEKGRQQKVPVTLDDMARVSERLLKMQVRSRETGQLDLAETLRRAINKCYLDRLADPDLKETMSDAFEEILTGTTGQVNYEGNSISRKELFDKLVEDISMSGEDKERKEVLQQEAEQRELEQAKFSAEDQLEKLLSNPDVSDKVKEILKG